MESTRLLQQEGLSLLKLKSSDTGLRVYPVASVVIKWSDNPCKYIRQGSDLEKDKESPILYACSMRSLLGGIGGGAVWLE